MDFARVQFEFRFSPILNFNSIFREKLSPYLKVASAFQLGQNNGSLVLLFEDDWQLDCRWDRLIFLSQGDIARFSEKQSTIKYLFEIYDLLRSLNSFGKTTHYVSQCNAIKVINSPFETIRSEFKSKYLKINESMLNNEGLDDVAITLDFKKGNKNISFSFGPYNSKIDIARRNLYPLKPRDEEENGLMSEVKIIESIEGVIDREIFLNSMDLASSYHDKLKS